MHLGKLIAPTHLAVLAFAKDTSWVPGAVVALLLVGGGMVIRQGLYWWGLASFLVFLLPTLPVSDFLILENRLYVPAMAILVAVATAVSHAASRWPSAQRGLVALTLAAIGGGATLTWRYSESFRNPAVFTEAAVRESPHLGLAHLNRGIVLQLDGKVDQARQEYETAIALDPDQAITHNNLALVEMQRGDLSSAERLLRRELELNPTYDKAHFNLGLSLARQGRVGEAAASWREALRLNSANVDARTNLDQAEAVLAGRPSSQMMAQDVDKLPTDLLIALYKDALTRDPDNQAIRAAYRELCRKRSLTCSEP